MKEAKTFLFENRLGQKFYMLGRLVLSRKSYLHFDSWDKRKTEEDQSTLLNKGPQSAFSLAERVFYTQFWYFKDLELRFLVNESLISLIWLMEQFRYKIDMD